MENENDALDLLLSLQSEDLRVESPRSAPDRVAVDVVEAGDISSSANLSPITGMKSCSRTVKPHPSNPPSAPESGYYSDESCERPKRNVTMAAFRDAVKNSLEDLDSSTVVKFSRPKPTGNSLACNQVDVDQHSGLRISFVTSGAAVGTRVLMYFLLPTAQSSFDEQQNSVSSLCSEVLVLRVHRDRLAGMAANFKGEWATVGVLTEKGQPKLSAAGKNFAVWKLASLDGAVISAFVFGDAYALNWKESTGAVFAVFSAKVRLDEKSKQPSLSIFNGNQMLKIGSSADFAVCKGKRVSGGPCTMVVNRRLQGDFCQHHLGAAYQKIKTKRAEISGGNLATAFSGPGTKRAQTVKATPKSPLKESKYSRPIKQLNSADLQKVLSTAASVTSNVHSQGMRFLETRSRHHHDQEQKLESLKKKATTELPKTRKKARVPMVEKLEGRSTVQNLKEPAKSNLVELDIDEIDDDMDQARMFFSSAGHQGLKTK